VCHTDTLVPRQTDGACARSTDGSAPATKERSEVKFSQVTGFALSQAVLRCLDAMPSVPSRFEGVVGGLVERDEEGECSGPVMVPFLRHGDELTCRVAGNDTHTW
jgi:hypothetical protein